MSRSGVFWKIVNIRSSSLLKMAWKNSLKWLRSLSSISIVITLPLNIFAIWKIQPAFINSIDPNGEKYNGAYIDLI